MNPKIRLPFEGKYPITFRFGENPDWYVRRVGYPHNGVDFGMPRGTPVLACDDGKVWYADNIPDSDGIGINIGHEWGLSQYWHLTMCVAKWGDEVKKGETIGFSGDTGWATGPHLHFGIKVKDDSPPGMRGWTNPVPYLEGPVFQPMLPAIESRTYRVRIGDSLWKIALKFYGNGYHWRKIFDANKDKIGDPGLIYPFQKLVIP